MLRISVHKNCGSFGRNVSPNDATCETLMPGGYNCDCGRLPAYSALKSPTSAIAAITR
jgi:hypothetical protein